MPLLGRATMRGSSPPRADVCQVRPGAVSPGFGGLGEFVAAAAARGAAARTGPATAHPICRAQGGQQSVQCPPPTPGGRRDELSPRGMVVPPTPDTACHSLRAPVEMRGAPPPQGVVRVAPPTGRPGKMTPPTGGGFPCFSRAPSGQYSPSAPARTEASLAAPVAPSVPVSSPPLRSSPPVAAAVSGGHGSPRVGLVTPCGGGVSPRMPLKAQPKGPVMPRQAATSAQAMATPRERELSPFVRNFQASQSSAPPRELSPVPSTASRPRELSPAPGMQVIGAQQRGGLARTSEWSAPPAASPAVPPPPVRAVPQLAGAVAQAWRGSAAPGGGIGQMGWSSPGVAGLVPQSWGGQNASQSWTAPGSSAAAPAGGCLSPRTFGPATPSSVAAPPQRVSNSVAAPPQRSVAAPSQRLYNSVAAPPQRVAAPAAAAGWPPGTVRR